jgi:hypothetical protein
VRHGRRAYAAFGAHNRDDTAQTWAFPRRRSSPAAWTAAALSTVSQKACTDMRGAGAICASSAALEAAGAEILSATAAC